MKQRVCLVMIVKNESAVLDRALKSIAEHVDCACIVDTGSNRGEFNRQLRIVSKHFKDKEYVYDQDRWLDFAHNRTKAMRTAENAFRLDRDDYLFMLDADDEVITFPRYEYTEDAYYVTMRSVDIQYRRLQLFKVAPQWHYRGVVHEFPQSCQQGDKIATLAAIVRSNREGSRARNAKTYMLDAKALRQALKEDKDPFMQRRYTFYLAQSLRDARDWSKAVQYYMARIALGGWDEEIYVSYLEWARCAIRLEVDAHNIVRLLVMAQNVCPGRREASTLAMRVLREAGRHGDAVSWACLYPTTAPPVDGLFIEPDAYGWRYHDELSVSFYARGNFDGCVRHAKMALDTLPAWHVDTPRITANIDAALRALGRKG